MKMTQLKKLAVEWPTVDTSEVGEQEIEGTIKGASGLAYREPRLLSRL